MLELKSFDNWNALEVHTNTRPVCPSVLARRAKSRAVPHRVEEFRVAWSGVYPMNAIENADSCFHRNPPSTLLRPVCNGKECSDFNVGC